MVLKLQSNVKLHLLHLHRSLLLQSQPVLCHSSSSSNCRLQ